MAPGHHQALSVPLAFGDPSLRNPWFLCFSEQQLFSTGQTWRPVLWTDIGGLVLECMFFVWGRSPRPFVFSIEAMLRKVLEAIGWAEVLSASCLLWGGVVFNQRFAVSILECLCV